LTSAQAGQELRMVYSGLTVTKITLGGTQEDVDIMLGTPSDTVQGIQNLLIPGPTGSVRLGAIATITQTYGPTQITHLGGVRTATVSATVTSSNVGAVSQNVQRSINNLSLPSGATVSLGGVTASQSQAFLDLGLALLIAILLVYLVMVATFRSIVQPLIQPLYDSHSLHEMLADHDRGELVDRLGEPVDQRWRDLERRIERYRQADERRQRAVDRGERGRRDLQRLIEPGDRLRECPIG